MQFFDLVDPVVAFAQNLSKSRNKMSIAGMGIKQILQYLHLGMNYMVIFDTKLQHMTLQILIFLFFFFLSRRHYSTLQITALKLVSTKLHCTYNTLKLC